VENPATWGDAENVIHNAIVKDHYAKLAEPELCGLSLPRQIADALREARLLNEDPVACDNCGISYLAFTFRFCRGCGKQV
jgi:hypothetical protein